MHKFPGKYDKTYRNILKGDGQGRFENYSPPIKRNSFSSSGCGGSAFGLTVKREYHFVSTLERDFFDIIDFKSSTIDIREQYPLLPVESTLLTAERLNLKHPQKYGHPTIMTSDFFIIYFKNNEISKAVRQIKYTKDLSDPRVLELFAIEKKWWQEHGVEDWKIVTEKQVDRKRAENIRELKTYWDLRNKELFHNFTQQEISQLTQILKQDILSSNEPIIEIIKDFDHKTGLDGGGIRIYKHLACHKLVPFDLNKSDYGIEEKRI